MNNLGVMHERGRGVDRDPDKAIEWYKKGAARGSDLAAFNLGRIYEKGIKGVDADAAEALKWYRKAASMGHAEAKQKVKELE
jgi:TPR repeat protein